MHAVLDMRMHQPMQLRTGPAQMRALAGRIAAVTGIGKGLTGAKRLHTTGSSGLEKTSAEGKRPTGLSGMHPFASGWASAGALKCGCKDNLGSC
jgi:hypothetical protein